VAPVGHLALTVKFSDLADNLWCHGAQRGLNLHPDTLAHLLAYLTHGLAGIIECLVQLDQGFVVPRSCCNLGSGLLGLKGFQAV
jgi:hypothetical protein